MSQPESIEFKADWSESFSAAREDVGQHTCCWHRALAQHAAIGHQDTVCCHCGRNRCIQASTKPALGHGRFCPERVYVPGVMPFGWREVE